MNNSRSLFIIYLSIRLSEHDAILLEADEDSAEFRIALHIFRHTILLSLKLAAQTPTSHH